MREIPLTRGLVALVDDEDFEELNSHKWYADKDGYACRAAPHPVHSGKRTLLMMHRVILGLQYGDARQGDHRDGNKANNQRGNLRIATRQQNLQNVGAKRRNTSGFKGVCFVKRTGKWRASIRNNGQPKFLGDYCSPELAHAAYVAAATKMHGEFLNLKVGECLT